MLHMVMCSDSKCPLKKTCLRFIVDPAVEITRNKNVRVEHSLRDTQTQQCLSYRPVNLTRHMEEHLA